MKRVLSVLTAIVFLTIASVSSSKAQVNVSVNIGAQPMWGPVCNTPAEYYYLPDIECYYYVPRRQFVYLSGRNWVFSYNLPERCRGYDLYSGYKVVCNEPRPYAHFYRDREEYARYRGYCGRQQVWRDYRGHGGGYYGHGGGRYYEAYEHPGNNGRGHAYGHFKEHGHGHGHERWDD